MKHKPMYAVLSLALLLGACSASTPTTTGDEASSQDQTVSDAAMSAAPSSVEAENTNEEAQPSDAATDDAAAQGTTASVGVDVGAGNE